MKRKGLLVLSSVFASVALIATGFAAFVISYTTEGTASGNIEVDGVDNRSFIVTVDTTHEVENIVYGAKQYEGTNPNPWMIYEDSDKNESLTTTIKLTCTNAQQLATTQFNITITANDAYQAALSEGYVGELPTVGNGIIITEDSIDENGVGSYTITVTFTWGTTFGGKNPIDHYNELSAEQYSVEAYNHLSSDAFKGLEDSQFNVTIVPVPQN